MPFLALKYFNRISKYFSLKAKVIVSEVGGFHIANNIHTMVYKCSVKQNMNHSRETLIDQELLDF